MSVLDVDDAILLKVDSLKFTVFAEQSIQHSGSFFLANFNGNLYLESPALLIEAAYASSIFLMLCMSRPPKHVFSIVVMLQTVTMSWNSMIVSAVLAFSTAASSKVNAEDALVLGLVCFGVA